MNRAHKPKKLPSGRWQIRWYDADEARQSRTFDLYNDAAAALHKEMADAAAIKAGLKARPLPKKTFADLRDSWLATRALHKRSVDADKSRLRAHLIPAFGHLELTKIDYEQVEEFKAARLDLSPATRRHLLILLGSMLKHAKRMKWIAEVPPIDKPSVRALSADYSYLRTGAEVQRFLRAAHEEGRDAFLMYATAVFSGMRQGELAALRWDRVSFETGLITVDRSFNGPTKASDVRYVPIQNALLPTLREWKLQCPGSLVFPNQVGEMHKPKDRIFCERFRRVLTAAGFEKEEMQRRQAHYIRFHDLRHTFASHYMMQGGDLFKLQKMLGHKDPELTMRYAHLSPHAFDKDRGLFAGLSMSETGQVLPMARKVAGKSGDAAPRAESSDPVRAERRQGPVRRVARTAR